VLFLQLGYMILTNCSDMPEGGNFAETETNEVTIPYR
jgi:hypothetical protein